MRTDQYSEICERKNVREIVQNLALKESTKGGHLNLPENRIARGKVTMYSTCTVHVHVVGQMTKC